MKVKVQYRYTLLGGTTANSFAVDAQDRAKRFFGEDADDVTVVVTTIGAGVNIQYRGECVAVKGVQT